MIRQDDATVKEPRMYWLVRAITAGFLATIVVTLVLAATYSLALLIGSQDPQAPALLRWTWALTHNTLTQGVSASLPLVMLLHFLAGIGWAIVYAALVEPYLQGPGWRKGLLFSLVPWILSLAVFLPAVGAGFLGLELGAGPLPIIGNLLLHLVYGATLGQLCVSEIGYPVGETEEADTRAEISATMHARTTMAAGIIVGLVIGGVVGWAFDVAFAVGFGTTLSVFIGMLVGSAFGILIGSFWGLSPQEG